MNKILLITLLATTFFARPVLVAAQAIDAVTSESSELGVFPATAFLKIQQGGSATHTITLENTSAHTIRVAPRIVDFRSDNRTGTPLLTESTTFQYLEGITDPNKLDTLLLQPKEKAALKLAFTIPSNAPSKEYPLTILFETTPDVPQPVVGAGAGIKTVIGSNLVVLITNTQEAPTLLSVSQLKTASVHDSFAGISFTPVVKNSSFASSVASSSAQIKNWRGKVVQTFEGMPVVVLGASSREIQTLPSNSDTPVAFEYKPSYLLGWYTLEFTVQTGLSTAPDSVTATRIVFALPFAVIAVLFSVIASLLYFGYKKGLFTHLRSI